MHTQSSKSIALVLILAILAGFSGGVISSKWTTSNSLEANKDSQILQPVEFQLKDEKSAVIDAIEKISPSVVSIVITQELKNIRSRGSSPFELFFKNDPFFEEFFGQRFKSPKEGEPKGQDEGDTIRRKVGGGSGFIVNEDGLIVTNRHVVANDDVEYTVMLNDDTEFEAEVVSRDFFNDIAVIKIIPEEGSKLPKLTPVQLGSSGNIKIGQSVIAIGNALAEFENSATKGIISATGREIIASDGRGKGESLSGLIQTDAAINPGNSGGPLINLAGEVVAVNTAIAANANGIGFAIPIDEVKPVIESIKEHGRIIRPILGVMFTMLTPELTKELDLDIDEGALLRGDGENFAVLPGKPAEKAGLQEKDVITAINDVKITKDHPLQKEIIKHQPGDTITITFVRKGQERKTEVTLDEAKPSPLEN